MHFSPLQILRQPLEVTAKDAKSLHGGFNAFIIKDICFYYV